MINAGDLTDAVKTACERVGLDSTSLVALHHHATPVYRIEQSSIVVRVSRGEDRERARTSVKVVQWVSEQGLPVTQPAPVEQPVEVADVAVTFWTYYPQRPGPPPGAAALGAILRKLHRLSPPPTPLPRYIPLGRLGAVLDAETSLPPDDHRWLASRRRELLADYGQLNSTLGEGFIHGDAYPGNTLWNGDEAILGDWDEIATGPRELDLINTHQGARMGRSAAEREAFTAAYGWDVTKWDGYPTLRAMRDLHTLAAFIQRATAGDQRAADELTHRIRTLRSGDTGARWRSA